MKITFSILSTGKEDAPIANNYLEEELLGIFPFDICIYDDLTVEIDADGSTWEDVPSAVQDAINTAIDRLAEDYGISIEVDTVSAQ